jgi:hypothetical protein
MLGDYPGYLGVHTQDQADGALPNGTRVKKVTFEKGDSHPIGSLATVLGSLESGIEPPYLYFIEFDDMPRFAIGIASNKIAVTCVT